MGKTIVITGGTGGIGYQAGLALAKADPQNVIVITGRSAESGKAAVETMKKDSGNPNIHLALADLSMQSAVRSLAQDLMARFPAIDVLVNNAGNLSPSDRGLEMVKEGGQTIVKNFSVNVMAPLLLSRLLVPALKKATPVGNVQITSGGMLVDGFSLDDIEAKKVQVGIPAYSQSKRVMEAMSLALSKEFEPHGIPVNIIGGGNPGATAMTSVVGSKDLPPWMRCCYPCFSCFMHRDDKGKSAATCAAPVIWGAMASNEEIGNANFWIAKPKQKKPWPKGATDPNNQKAIMEYCQSKIIAETSSAAPVVSVSATNFGRGIAMSPMPAQLAMMQPGVQMMHPSVHSTFY